jgi:zinc transport system substrate-binding protein
LAGNILFPSGCSHQQSDSGKINIVVSILPLADFAEKIGGDFVEVTVLVPAGASPHAYEPKPSQLVQVSQADVFVKVGTPIEFEVAWLEKLIALNKKMLVVDASESVALIFSEEKHSHDEDGQNHSELEMPDPHIWLSPVNAQIMVDNIYQGLIKVDGAHADLYKQNKDDFIKKLKLLDLEISQKFENKKRRQFLVYHPAWGYFAHQYNLNEISIEAEGKSPTAKSLQETIEIAQKNKIKLVIGSPQFDRRHVDLIAREIGARVVLLSPLEKDFLPTMRNFAQILSEVME